MNKLRVGNILSAKEFETVTGGRVTIPDPNGFIHLQFRRFVDCPICNTHIGELKKRADEIKAAGIREVIFFHSSANAIRSYQKDVPFTLVADPKKVFYREFGVESSIRFMSLRALGAGIRGMVHGHFGLRPAGGPLGLPADFLIAPSGHIHAVKYGKHAYDQWSVDELLALAKSTARAA